MHGPDSIETALIFRKKDDSDVFMISKSLNVNLPHITSFKEESFYIGDVPYCLNDYLLDIKTEVDLEEVFRYLDLSDLSAITGWLMGLDISEEWEVMTIEEYIERYEK